MSHIILKHSLLTCVKDICFQACPLKPPDAKRQVVKIGMGEPYLQAFSVDACDGYDANAFEQVYNDTSNNIS